MNILYLCDEYPPGKHGGIGTSVRLLAREMARLGNQVVVAGLYSAGYGGEDAFEDEGVKVYRFRRGYKWVRNEQSLIVKIFIKLLKFTGLMDREIRRSLAIYNFKLEKLIADHKIDLVEMPDYNDYIRFCRSYIPFPALSVPVIVKLHGSITYFTKELNKKVPAHVVKMEQAILNQAATVSSVSKYTALKSAVYLAYPREMEVLYNAINTKMPVKPTRKNLKQVIFTGTIVQKKGIYQLLEAWNKVNTTRSDAQLIILGKGSQRKAIVCLTKKARNTVTFVGHVATEKLYDYLAGSLISVFPSYFEAFSLAPLEAMACSTAVINSNRSSGPELIDDKINGLLIDPDDTDQIATAILSLLNDPEECERLAKNGNGRVKEHFDIQKIAVQHIQFYKKVVSGIQ